MIDENKLNSLSKAAKSGPKGVMPVFDLPPRKFVKTLSSTARRAELFRKWVGVGVFIAGLTATIALLITLLGAGGRMAQSAADGKLLLQKKAADAQAQTMPAEIEVTYKPAE